MSLSFEPLKGVRAHAKINLGLEVLGRRDDGYHELRTILQTIDFYDELSFAPKERGIEITTTDPALPTGEANLVYRAAALLAERGGAREGVAIHLKKNLPSGAGLGGGSSDAAATLRILDRLWGLGASSSDLHDLATLLGMDVPFFLHGGTALAVGRGDEVYPLDAKLDDLPIVLILPSFSLSTAAVYGNLELTRHPSGRKLLHFAWNHPTRVGLDELVNDLEGATGGYVNSIRELKQLLFGQGATASMMSGSGSAIFGIFQDEASAREAAATLGRSGARTLATRTVSRRALREQPN